LDAREAISDIKNECVRNMDLEMDFYLMGIDASIMDDSPDKDLIR
jgi:hypothetical protein